MTDYDRLRSVVCARCGHSRGHKDRGTHFLCPRLDWISTGRITRAEFEHRIAAQALQES